MNIHLSRLLRCFVVAVVLILCTSSSFLGYAQQPEISVGETVRVITDGQRLNLRKKPGLAGEIVGKLENGDTMRVIGGPRSADGYEWWELEGEARKGWAASRFLQVTESATSKASGSKESPVVTAGDTARGIVDIYGFEGKCTRPDGTKDDLNTSKLVEVTADLLKQIYDEPGVNVNASARDAKEKLAKDEVFVFFGHGEPGRIEFHDPPPSCNYSYISSSDRDELPDAPNLKLVVIFGCSVGKDLLEKFKEETGATKVIGFKKDLGVPAARMWNNNFWDYVSDGIEVGAAAEQATKDIMVGSIIGIEGDPSSIVVVLGDDPVRLRHPSKKTTWWERLKAKIADWLEELEKKVADWQEEQKEKAKEKAKEELQRQLCGAPAGLVIISGYQFWRWRKRSKRPS